MYRERPAFALAMAALAAILLPSSLTAQITFQRTYGGADADWGNSVQQTADGGYVIAGATYSYGAGQTDVYILRTAAHGDTLWTRTLGGTGLDEAYSVKETEDGGYILAGVTRPPPPAYATDAYVAKFNSDGNVLWTRTFGGSYDDEARSVLQTDDRGYVITGSVHPTGPGSTDVWLIKTDSLGDTLWTRTYGGSQYDNGYSIQEAADHGYFIAGSTNSFGAGGTDVYLIKTDSAGDTLWTRTFGGTNADVARSVGLTADSGCIITGYTMSFGAGFEDIYVIKTDKDGNTAWTRTCGWENADRGYSVQQTGDRGFLVAGYAEPSGYVSDVFLMKTDANGDTLWTRTFGGAGLDDAGSVEQTADSGYVIAGYTESFGGGDGDVWLIKTDSGARVSLAEPKPAPTSTPALSVTCEPNPFRTRTAISLQLASDSPAELAIFDAGGRRVRTSTVNRAPYAVWDGRDDFGKSLPSGTYFVRVNAGNERATTRLVLQR